MSDIYAVLDALNISYVRHDHEAAFTVEQAEQIYGQLEGGKTKNLFLRNKKGRRHYLLVAEQHQTVDLKALRAELGESSLSFASPERLMKYLGLTPGSVSPFGLINDKEQEVVVLLDKTLLDKSLQNMDPLNFHPNINTATLSISQDDFLRFLGHCGNEVRTVELAR